MILSLREFCPRLFISHSVNIKSYRMSQKYVNPALWCNQSKNPMSGDKRKTIGCYFAHFTE